MQPRQLTLGLSLKNEATFDNFFVGHNQEVLASLHHVAAGSGERVVYLCGVQSVGCSHLLQATCHAAHQHGLRSVYLPLAELVPSTSYEVLQGFDALDVVCLDEMDAIAGNRVWEEAVFHLYNRVYDQAGRIVMAAHDLPKNMNWLLPDLASRLSWGVLYQVQPLLDQEKQLVLMQRAERRGIRLSDEVARFILTHCPRHMATLFEALDALDQASLATHRRLTIPFVKAILQI